MTAVSEIMTADVYTAQPTTTVAEVAEAMVRGRFGSAVVGDARMILGIFTERDVLRAAAAGTDPTASKIWWVSSVFGTSCRRESDVADHDLPGDPPVGTIPTRIAGLRVSRPWLPHPTHRRCPP